MSLGNATIVSDDEVLLLGSTTLKIVLIHALGYFAASAGLLNKTALGGLGQFVRCFALPALLFQGIATLNMADLNAPLLCVVIIAKGCIFLATAGIGYLWQGNLRGSGIFALASTMSDDLGLGVPLLSPLFGEAHTKMLYILAAIQAIVFNPIAYVLLALGPEKPATIFISYRVASEKVRARPTASQHLPASWPLTSSDRSSPSLFHRVTSDQALALDLWKRLVARGLSVWLDQKDLEDGQPWEDGFADALLSSTIMVPLLSKAGLASFAGLRSDSSCDSLLLEQVCDLASPPALLRHRTVSSSHVIWLILLVLATCSCWRSSRRRAAASAQSTRSSLGRATRRRASTPTSLRRVACLTCLMAAAAR
jgi:hypothetical protein